MLYSPWDGPFTDEGDFVLQRQFVVLEKLYPTLSTPYVSPYSLFLHPTI